MRRQLNKFGEKKMTTQNIHRAAAAIKVRYIKMGGKPELFDAFLKALINFNDFFPGEYSRPSQIIGKVFGPKYTGDRVKFDIREVVGKRANPSGNKTYSILDKKYI